MSSEAPILGPRGRWCFKLLSTPLSRVPFWRFLITGADQNQELKLWCTVSWNCLQTIRSQKPLVWSKIQLLRYFRPVSSTQVSHPFISFPAPLFFFFQVFSRSAELNSLPRPEGQTRPVC